MCNLVSGAAYNAMAKKCRHQLPFQFLSYYVEFKVACKEHNLTNLADDFPVHVTLDQFPCFPFESALYLLKNLINAPDKPDSSYSGDG